MKPTVPSTRGRRYGGPAVLLLLAAGWWGGSTGCTDPPPPSLNSADRKLIDSLYRDSAAIKRAELDSLCALRRPALVQQLTDSILRSRLADRARQLERLQKQTQ